MTATVVAEDDPRLGARIVRCEPLVYSDPAPDELDRPPHVRAASGIVRVGGELVVVQDDASFVAVRRADGRVEGHRAPGRARRAAALRGRARQQGAQARSGVGDPRDAGGRRRACWPSAWDPRRGASRSRSWT
ncbi:MAG: hypothetical protein M5U28_20110 [Sandaracinaceae bacterium]|nr:hypothetical protein [Sandaracinaceae bacterium]